MMHYSVYRQVGAGTPVRIQSRMDVDAATQLCDQRAATGGPDERFWVQEEPESQKERTA